jgi:hypothetical protein
LTIIKGCGQPELPHETPASPPGLICGIGSKLTYVGSLMPPAHDIHLTDEQRLDWLRLIRSQNVGPRGIMAQTPQALLRGTL